MSFPKIIYGDAGDQFDNATTQTLPLGTTMIYQDGRQFVYVEVGSVATVAGSLYQSEAFDSNVVGENPTETSAAGATTVTLDVAATPVADVFKGGFLVDETNGKIYHLQGNTAADPTVVTLSDPDGLDEDVVAADTVSLYKSPFKDVIVKVAAAATAPVIGVAPTEIPADSFGWLQTKGLCAVVAEDVLVVGDAVIASPVNDAGAVAAAIDDTDQPVGRVLEIGANGAIATIFLAL